MNLSLKTSSIFAAVSLTMYSVYTLMYKAGFIEDYLWCSYTLRTAITYTFSTLLMIGVAVFCISLYTNRKQIPQFTKTLLWQARIITAILVLFICYNIIRKLIGPDNSYNYFEYIFHNTISVGTWDYNLGLSAWIATWLWQFAFYHPKNIIESIPIGYIGLVVAILVSVMAIIRLVFPCSLSNIWTSWLLPISACLLFLISLIEQRRDRNLQDLKSDGNKI